jgi:hypothetical protein
MSLRILVKSDQIQSWISKRNGAPARKRGSDTDLRVLFGEGNGEYEHISVDELIEAMKFARLVLLVDQGEDKTFYKFVERG